MKVGFGTDWTGVTRKYLILAETTDGRYVVKSDTIDKIGLRLIDKDKITLCKEEK